MFKNTDVLALIVAALSLIVPAALEYFRAKRSSKEKKESKLDSEILKQRNSIVDYINDLDKITNHINQPDNDNTEKEELKKIIVDLSIKKNKIFSLFPVFQSGDYQTNELLKMLKSQNSATILLNIIKNTQNKVLDIPNNLNRSVETREEIIRYKETISYLLADYIPKARAAIFDNKIRERLEEETVNNIKQLWEDEINYHNSDITEPHYMVDHGGVGLENKDENAKVKISDRESMTHSSEEAFPTELLISDESVRQYYERVASLFTDDENYNLAKLQSISARFNKEGAGEPSWKEENRVTIDKFGTFYININRSVAQDVVKEIYRQIKRRS